MNKINYQLKLDDILNSLQIRPKLLLHSCCGPCSTYVIDYLKDYFDITVFYYNPNIEPKEEYIKRKEEQIRLLEILGIPLLDDDYENEKYREVISGLENELEGGKRCFLCYNLRLEECAKEANDNNYDYFCTTLTVSPYKNAAVINELGEKLSLNYKVKWLYSDFKKNDGYKKSIEFSKLYNLYRQDYCGCEFSTNTHVNE